MNAYKAKCDKLASEIVRSLGYCERCGSSNQLTPSHIIARRYSATRTDLNNVQCLCFTCHRRLTDLPDEWRNWIDYSIGKPEYERLRTKAENFSGKFDWQAEYERLKQVEVSA